MRERERERDSVCECVLGGERECVREGGLGCVPL